MPPEISQRAGLQAQGQRFPQRLVLKELPSVLVSKLKENAKVSM